MYLYFDANGVLKEIITDRPFRQGDSKRNKIYVYWEGEHSVASGWVKYRKPDGSVTAETSFYSYPASLVEKVLPDKPLRNLKYFSYDHTYIKDGQTKVGYEFYEITVPTAVLNSSLNDDDKIPTSNNMIVASIRFVMIDSGTLGQIDDNDTIEEMGAVVFSVETNIGILTDTSIDETQYNYLVWLLGNKANTADVANLVNDITNLEGDVTNLQTAVANRVIRGENNPNADQNLHTVISNSNSNEPDTDTSYGSDIDLTMDEAKLKNAEFSGANEYYSMASLKKNILLLEVYENFIAELTSTIKMLKNLIELRSNNVKAYANESIELRKGSTQIRMVTQSNNKEYLELYSYNTLLLTGVDRIVLGTDSYGAGLIDGVGFTVGGDGYDLFKVSDDGIEANVPYYYNGNELATINYVDTKDANLQSQIDGINAGQNLADIVANLTALNNLSIANLKNGDKVQVLSDSNHDNASTVYRLYISGGTYSWIYIGKYGQNAYTKSEVDALLSAKADLSNSSQTITARMINLETIASNSRLELVKKDGNAILAGIDMLSNVMEIYSYNETGTHQNARVVISGNEDNSKIHFWTDEHLAMTIENDQKVLFEKGAYVYDSDDDDYYELVNSKDLAGKQDVLTAGSGITIQDNVISTSGSGIELYEHTLSGYYDTVNNTHIYIANLLLPNNTPITKTQVGATLYECGYRGPESCLLAGGQYYLQNYTTRNNVIGLYGDSDGYLHMEFINDNGYNNNVMFTYTGSNLYFSDTIRKIL